MGVFITGLERGEKDSATDSLDSRRRLEEAIKARISGRFLYSLEDFKLSSSRLMHSRRLMHRRFSSIHSLQDWEPSSWLQQRKKDCMPVNCAVKDLLVIGFTVRLCLVS